MTRKRFVFREAGAVDELEAENVLSGVPRKCVPPWESASLSGEVPEIKLEHEPAGQQRSESLV